MSVKGLGAVLARFKQMPEEIKEDVLDAVEEITLLIERQAIDNAPVAGSQVATTHGYQKINTGINQYIHSKFTNSGLSGSIYVEEGATELAAYIEFGTGVSAAGYVPTLDPEFQAMAKKFYINGKGTLIKHPYLLPAYFEHAPKLREKIKVALSKLKL